MEPMLIAERGKGRLSYGSKRWEAAAVQGPESGQVRDWGRKATDVQEGLGSASGVFGGGAEGSMT